jgi:DeoR family transcriptional regulator, suf operon transcriptional repressor
MTDVQPTASPAQGNLLPWKGLRSSILIALKRSRGATARELASELGVSLNAVRHHLKDFESEGLVQYERSHKGVGAPAFTYRLSLSGEALFPRRYEATVTQLLDHLVQREGRGAAVSMLEERYQSLAVRLREELTGATPANRLAAVARLLSEEGYMAEAQVSGSGGTLVEHNCAIQAVAERFPEICAAEARFLASVLGATVDRQGHILTGCSACEYRVQFESANNGEAALPGESI